MNRIERMLWEESNLRQIERAKQRSRAAILARAVTIASVVGVLLMLATRPAPSMETAGLNPLVSSASAAQPEAAANAARAMGSMASMARDGKQAPPRVYGPGEPTEAAF